MADEKQGLSVDEQESIAEAVLRIVAAFDNFPGSVNEGRIYLDDMKEAESIGIYPTNGAVVSKTYISGSFEATFPFTIYYKCNPENNQVVIEKREVLSGLSEWMENMEYPALTEGRKIQSIKRNTAVILSGKDEEGNAIFQCGFILKYFKKRS